tara:strand:+ start:2514 stop:2915 length:402 start_codon:yes stop_codon:yes gene_type:complete
MLNASVVVLIYGFILLVLALKFLKSPNEIKLIAKHVEGDHGVAFFAGLIPLIIGTVVLFHFAPLMTGAPMNTLATILGGLTTLIGVYRLWFTPLWGSHLKAFAASKHLHVVIGLYFIIAVVLLLIGGHVIAIG